MAVKEAEDLELSKLQEAKRKKKKALKERKKLHDRINLKMIIKDDEPIIEEDRELFKLSQIKNRNVSNHLLFTEVFEKQLVFEKNFFF